MPPVLRSPLSRIALGVLAVFALAVGVRGLRAARARTTLPTGAAEWIWNPLARDASSPLAFSLVRDFELDPPPARGQLLVAADEEYILYLNGRRIGSGAYSGGRRGALLDRYEVGGRLSAGTNRLQAEVRSGRGAGGFLLALVGGAAGADGAHGRFLLGTDGSWRVFRRDHPFLLRGLVPLAPELTLGTGEEVYSWGLPPLGRWGVPEPGPERPLYDDWTAGLAPIPAVQALTLDTPPAPGYPPVPRRVFDFGREVTGYLHLETVPDPVQRAGLLYTGIEALPEVPAARTAGAVITIPSRAGWEDAALRRFRYVVVVGLMPTAARVQPVDPSVPGLAALLPRTVRPTGLLGIVPPPLRAPVEDEVWRKFQRVPSVAGREDL